MTPTHKFPLQSGGVAGPRDRLASHFETAMHVGYQPGRPPPATTAQGEAHRQGDGGDGGVDRGVPQVKLVYANKYFFILLHFQKMLKT